MNGDDSGEERESLVGIARKWLPWCLGLIYVITAGWSAFVVRHEIIYQDHDSLETVAVAAALKTAAVVPLIILCGMFIVPAIDFIGGVMMVTARYLTNKFVKPLIERHKAEGRAEANAEWRAWYNRMMDARAANQPFDEPPPPASLDDNRQNGDMSDSDSSA